jgi:hypothetical protein
MRRLAAISVFLLVLAIPVWAQHGGGHGGGGGGHASSGGGHASFGGSHSSIGHASGPHSSGSVHSYSGAGRSFSTPRSNFSPSPYAHNQFRSGGTHLQIRTYGFGNNRYGYGRWGYGYPWWGWGYYDPYAWSWWDDDAQFDQDYNDNLAQADQMDQQSLDEQRMWRQEQADGDQDAYAPYRRTPRSGEVSGTIGTSAPTPSTVLVFRDQRKEEIQNYAVVGTTLWNFAPQHTEKIPLSDLDLVATKKANDDRGITFDIPQSNAAPTMQSPSTPQPASTAPTSTT